MCMKHPKKQRKNRKKQTQHKLMKFHATHAKYFHMLGGTHVPRSPCFSEENDIYSF